jgi:Sulfotransferase domain
MRPHTPRKEQGLPFVVGIEIPVDNSKSVVESLDPVLVVSLPKAGTYLVAELLKSLGYRSTGLHLGVGACTDYSEADPLEARRNPAKFTRDEPLHDSLKRIGPGEFAVGHLPFRQEVLQGTNRFKRLYVTRDLRTALISYMRFLHCTGRMDAEKREWYAITDRRKRVVVYLSTTAPLILAALYENMVGWSQVRGIHHVRFEELTGREARAIGAVNSLASFLGVKSDDARRILRSSLAAETITRSDGLTKLNDYWSDEAEKWFVAIGGAELEVRLGRSIHDSADQVLYRSAGDKKAA